MNIFKKIKKIKNAIEEYDKLEKSLEISKEKYEATIVEKTKALEENKKQIMELTNIINGYNTDCNFGIWCKDCKYSKKIKCYNGEVFKNNYFFGNINYFCLEGKDEFYYCSKHIKDCCPEYEDKKYNNVEKNERTYYSYEEELNEYRKNEGNKKDKNNE